MIWSADLQFVVDDFTIDIAMESVRPTLALVGPNGAGKTTVLRALIGAYPLVSGHVKIAGRLCCDVAQRIDLAPERRHIAYVPQGSGLFPHLSVFDNVGFGLRRRDDTKSRVLNQLETAGITHLRDRLPRQLSGGECQQVALARALVCEPSLLLLDEPFSALDASTKRTLRQTLPAILEERNLATLLVSHERRDLEPFDPYVIVMEEGRCVQRGSLAELEREPASDFVREFLGL